MKKIVAVICVLMLLLAGCGNGPKIASEKDILKAMTGEYLRTDELKDFKKTKKVVGSFSTYRTLRVEKGEILVGDAHQGVGLGKIENAAQNESGNYTFEAIENEANSFIGEFSPETNIISGRMKSDFAGGYDNYIEFTRFGTYDELTSFLSSVVFADNENITEEEGKYFAEIDGKKVYLSVSPDTAEPVIADGCFGVIFMQEDGKKDRIGLSYKFEGDKLVLCDEDGVIIARI